MEQASTQTNQPAQSWKRKPEDTEPKYDKRSIFLVGHAGAGKTTSLKTLIGNDSFVEHVFLVSLEPSCRRAIAGRFPPEVMKRFHIVDVSPTSMKLQGLAALANKAQSYDNVNQPRERLQAAQAGARPEVRKAFDAESAAGKLLNKLTNIRTPKVDANGAIIKGEFDEWGDVQDFNDRCVLVLDSFTALTQIVMESAAGAGKIIKDRTDYGSAQDYLEALMMRLLDSVLHCHLVVLAHLDTSDSGSIASHIGGKIWGKMNRLFSDTVEACVTRDGNRLFRMDTSGVAGVKARSLESGNDRQQDFSPFFRK